MALTLSLPEVPFAKVTPWMRAGELQEWLEPGDLLEFKRDLFQVCFVVVSCSWLDTDVRVD